MSLDIETLSKIGWEPFYQQQLDSVEWEETCPVRVTAVHKGQLIVSDGIKEKNIIIKGKMLTEIIELQATVGDWLLLSSKTNEFIRLLDRKSLFIRKSPGTSNTRQLVAANVNTLFIVTSCNEDFNLSRLERYLAFAYDAGVEPVIILTKIDMIDDPDPFIHKAQTLNDFVMVEAVNALKPETLSPLFAWCKKGQTIALMGSSGVGKSTLVNSLGAQNQKTAPIREDDAKGRHTTTYRSLLPLSNGAILLDSPGMRQLQLSDSKNGLSEVFCDIEKLAMECRFKNCQHNIEPGCAIKNAIENGSLDPRRLSNYTKLLAEHERNTSTLAERRKRERALGKFYKSVKEHTKKKKNYP